MQRPFLLAAFAAGLVMAAVPLFAACSGDDDDSSGGSQLTLGALKVNDHGTTDVTGKTSIEFEADSYYFGPTFLKGTAGQEITLEIDNEADIIHNFSLTEEGVAQDIQAKGKAQVKVKFPESGVLAFFCKYHAGQGMAGELLVGDAKPAAPPQAGTTPGAAGSPAAGATSGGYTY